MKVNILLAVAVVVLSYVTCKNLQKTAAGSDAVVAPVPTNTGIDPTPWRASRAFDIEHPDSAYTYQVKEPPRRVEVPWDKFPPPSTSRRAYMASGWWYPLMAYQPSDTTVHRQFIGKWLKFREDLSFDLLVDNKVVETGHWNFDEEKMIVFLACQDPYYNNSWAVLERGFRMIWTGNTQINVTGIQVRMDNSPTPPPGK